ncbi:cytochrome c peroxidase [Herbaspirillum sp. RTI4]|uniref:cytochrome-c peroxidase n=1 Tax=Herbaspirillum sp. RTI4 TaxID=3048640 RepID=UPI002AB43467|nr:cytochrome c peroxidase [Herbaspirillum sp. RTI4]MDY7578007.1 cytochrome c peroxidase [Herbaspirillum sp. RTI4]MEA9982063.1 cytochrome c peroxidase [Herbaspirillum sp. RTI4]
MKTVLFGLLACTTALAASTREGNTPAPARPAYLQATYLPLASQPSVKELTAMGRTLFFDASLSASGKQSCASCHSPAHAFGPPNNLDVQLGGKHLRTQGTRATPSLRYLQTSPPFSEHYHDDDGDDSIDAGPTGGRTWDGRADSTHDQARMPLLSAHEMGNATPAAVVKKLQKAPYAAQFRQLFGAAIFEQPEQAFSAALMALEVFQENPEDFYPYTSKYDAFLRGQTTLSAQESRGLALFNAADKGNCASCHISAITPNGGFPQFTDYGLIAIGVPRNRRLAVNRHAAYADKGLCGPDRTDLRDHPEYCGRFKTPTLRNVALRQTFFHNGVFHSLQQVMEFYVQRDTHPEKWYPRQRDGSIRKFDDLPASMQGNVNLEAPFDRQPGDQPALSAAEIRDVIVFMNTLTDGYVRPTLKSPAAQP